MENYPSLSLIIASTLDEVFYELVSKSACCFASQISLFFIKHAFLELYFNITFLTILLLIMIWCVSISTNESSLAKKCSKMFMPKIWHEMKKLFFQSSPRDRKNYSYMIQTQAHNIFFIYSDIS